MKEPKIVKLAGYRGRSRENVESALEDATSFLWTATKEDLGEHIDGVVAKLKELQDDPDGIPLQIWPEGDASNSEDVEEDLLVDILDVAISDDEQAVQVTLRWREGEV